MSVMQIVDDIDFNKAFEVKDIEKIAYVDEDDTLGAVKPIHC